MPARASQKAAIHGRTVELRAIALRLHQIKSDALAAL
jgi:hypothetical protein